MTADPRRPQDRETALRALLVARVNASKADLGAADVRSSGSAGRPAPTPARTVLATVVVVVAVALATIAALNLPHAAAPAVSGMSSSGTPSASPTPGQVLAVLTSKDGPRQTRTVYPEGLALKVVYTCTGGGDFSIDIPHYWDQGGSCSPGGASANKGIAGSTPIRVVATGKRATWKVTVTAIAETYVTPTPVATATRGDGSTVPFCTSDDLAATYSAVRAPKEVTEADEGQIAFRNTGPTECALAGYPRLQFLDSTGRLIGKHSNEGEDQRDSTAKGIHPVLVAPGGRAYVQFDYYNPAYFKNDHITCSATTSGAIRIDLANRYAGAAQHGVFTLRTPPITACRNDTLQLFNTVFVGYAAQAGK